MFKLGNSPVKHSLQSFQQPNSFSSSVLAVKKLGNNPVTTLKLERHSTFIPTISMGNDKAGVFFRNGKTR